jgi:signal transduction histidine kinase/DNA-binding response OmpR family regulator
MNFILAMLQRYGEAAEKTIAALDIYQEIGDTARMAYNYYQLGSILTRQKQHQEAMPYIRKGILLELAQGIEPCDGYSRLGNAFAGAGQVDSALFYSLKAYAAATKTGNNVLAAYEQYTLSRLYVELGDFAQAKTLLSKALEYYQSSNDVMNLPEAYALLAKVENALGNHSAALDFAKKALDIAQSGRRFGTLTRIHQELSQSYAGMGDYQNAYWATLAWKKAADSLAVIEKTGLVADAESRYRAREQSATIAQQQLELERQQNRQFSLLLLGLLLFAGAAGIALYLRLKKQRAEHALRLEHAESQKLRELDKVKSAFFANISHEFRTPLTLLLGPLRDMESGRFNGSAPKYFGIMRRQAERLLQLVEQLLDLSRLESGKLQLTPQPGDLATALRSIAASFESLAAQKQIHFQIELPTEPLWTHFDRDKLEKIVVNLLSNAFKFTPEEGRISLLVDGFLLHEQRTTNNQQPITIRVEDSGIGIPANQLPHIFERFYRVENSEADHQTGSGIGLALTCELVLLHGGEISVESIENKGTVFTVRLPLTPAADMGMGSNEQFSSNNYPPKEAFPPAAPASERSPTASHQRPLILIVEDNADVQAYIREHLQEKYRILEATDGNTALEIARSELPDLIVTDLMMPGMDGVKMTQHLKADERTSHIPLVMLTAKAGRDNKLQGIASGAEAYLTKPFDPEELRLVVAKTLEQRRLLREKFSREIRLGLSDVEVLSLDDVFLQKVLATIEENLDDDLFGVEQLAASVSMSRSNLFRKLDALTGKSPTALIRELRLARAKKLLEQGAGNTTEVAMMVGFNTPAYFVKCFADQYGIPPGAFKKH